MPWRSLKIQNLSIACFRVSMIFYCRIEGAVKGKIGSLGSHADSLKAVV